MSFRTKIANLFETRKVMALGATGTFVYLSVTGKLSPAESLVIIGMVFTAYFAKKDENQSGSKE